MSAAPFQPDIELVDDYDAMRDIRLWRAVLAGMSADLLGRGVGMTPADQSAAEHWFRPGNPDFQQVCHLAGFEPEFILRKLEQHRTKPLTPAQRRFVIALQNGLSPAKAAKAAGCSRNMGQRWLRRAHVRKAVDAHRLPAAA